MDEVEKPIWDNSLIECMNLIKFVKILNKTFQRIHPKNVEGAERKKRKAATKGTNPVQ
jgi:hypothetical protein